MSAFYTRHETASYKLECDRIGNYLLTRKSDGATCYFQGEDGDVWSYNMYALEGVQQWKAGNTLDKSFDFIASGYDCVLEAKHAYHCYLFGAQRATEKTITAINSFEARRELALALGCKVTDIVSVALRYHSNP